MTYKSPDFNATCDAIGERLRREADEQRRLKEQSADYFLAMYILIKQAGGKVTVDAALLENLDPSKIQISKWFDPATGELHYEVNS